MDWLLESWNQKHLAFIEELGFRWKVILSPGANFCLTLLRNFVDQQSGFDWRSSVDNRRRRRRRRRRLQRSQVSVTSSFLLRQGSFPERSWAASRRRRRRRRRCSGVTPRWTLSVTLRRITRQFIDSCITVALGRRSGMEYLVRVSLAFSFKVHNFLF